MRLQLRALATYSIVAIATLAAAACGGSSGDDGPPTGDHHHYVADGIDVPVNTTQSQQYGMDIDGDTEGGDPGIDNQLGNVLAALSGQGFMVQPNIDASVDDGSIILLADFQTTDFANAGRSGLQVYQGDNPMPAACNMAVPPVCGQHLTGTATFTIHAMSPRDALVVGPVVNGVFTGGPGKLQLQISLAAGSTIPLTLIGAKAEARMITATGIASGKLAGAIPKTDIDNNIIPSIQVQLAGIIADDCVNPNPPMCNCMAGSTGEMLINLFDNDANCAVSVMEIQTDPLIMSLLAPDVTLCTNGPGTCDVATEGVDALSLGVGFTAVGAVYTP